MHVPCDFEVTSRISHEAGARLRFHLLYVVFYGRGQNWSWSWLGRVRGTVWPGIPYTFLTQSKATINSMKQIKKV